MMEIPEPWVLSLDRTEWQFGSKVFNILILDKNLIAQIYHNFSVDGKWLASAGRDSTIKFWQMPPAVLIKIKLLKFS
ncbi:MAG: WD40 repeat domain-containing protein [Cyanobacteria bacterium J06621_8]